MGSATRQGQLWGAEAQDGAELQEFMARPLWEAMLDAAAVGPGTRVLDAGCGAGGASVRAARRGAHVNGLDAAEALLAIARQRLPDGDFRVGDLEALPYPSETFDAIRQPGGCSQWTRRAHGAPGAAAPRHCRGPAPRPRRRAHT